MLNTYPDREGIETLVQAIGRWMFCRLNTYPDREGIETACVCARDQNIMLNTYPDREGIETACR